MINIVPAIDIIDGKCVRLTKGDFKSVKIYSNDPVTVAKKYEDSGIKHLHVVDLDGTRQKKIVNHKVLLEIAKSTALKIDFGGGIKNESDIQTAFDSGAKQITLGSIAVKDKNRVLKWLEFYSPDKFIIGADIRDEKIAVAGWQEQTDIEMIPFLKSYFEHGIKKTISTDINRDGMLSGPAFDLYKKLQNEIPGLFIVASGGVKTISDVEQLNKMQVGGVIIGKALYENTITLKDLETFLC